MPRTLFNFLDWRPDQDEYNTDGLQVADNILHEPEGYKPVHLVTTSAFQADLASITSIVTKSIFGSQNISCWLTNSNTLNFGIDATLSLWGTTGLPSTFSATGTNQSVDAFDATTLNDVVFAVGMAIQDPGSGTETIHNIGYATLTL